MPTGMLAPLPDASPRPAPDSPSERFTVARGKRSGQWVELQLARANDAPDRTSFDREQADSRFLSIDAMTLLHEPFARALPGFDLFLPRLFDPAALVRLQTELATFKAQLGAISSVAAAKVRWGGISSLVQGLSDDVSWHAARAALVATVDELRGLVEGLEKKGQGLWVLGN